MRNSEVPVRRRKAVNLLTGTAIVGLASVFAFLLQKKAPVAAGPEPASVSVDTESQPAVLPAPAPAAAATLASTARSGSDNDAAETERIQRYIDSIYSRDDVVSSFEAAPGEEVDCIGFYAQPAVKLAMAQGHRVRLEDYKAAKAKQTPMSPPSESAFDGRPDPEGQPRKCFGDTVPMMRTTVERIQRVGGLDAYLQHGGKKAPPPPPQPRPPAVPMDDPSYMHVVVEYDTPNVGTTIWGGQSIAGVYAPNVPNPTGGQPHSLAQTWTISGSQFYPCANGEPTGVACTSAANPAQCFQTIEVGWVVAPFSSIGGDDNPHLFTFTTQDGYWATGCYDIQSCITAACVFNAGDNPATFAAPCNQYSGGNIPNPMILATGTPFTPGMPLTSDISVTGSTPHELQFTTVWDEFAGWVIYVNGQLMAGFAPGTWDGSFYNLPNGTSPIQTTPGAPLQATKANTFQAGGEVAGGTTEAFDLSDNPSVVEMGNGFGAVLGYKEAAYHRDIGVGLENGAGPGLVNAGWSYPAFSTVPFVTDLNCYSLGFGLASGGPQTVSLTAASLGYTFLEYPSGTPTTSYASPAPGGSNWENYLYFGGLGNASGIPFSFTDPKGGTYDFCCSTAKQNGVAPDSQCPNSQLTNVCP